MTINDLLAERRIYQESVSKEDVAAALERLYVLIPDRTLFWQAFFFRRTHRSASSMYKSTRLAPLRSDGNTPH